MPPIVCLTSSAQLCVGNVDCHRTVQEKGHPLTAAGGQLRVVLQVQVNLK
jgi:hypothetical protein